MIILLNKKTIKYISLVITTVFVLCISYVLILSDTANVFNETLTGQSSDKGIPVPIVMYHSIMKTSPQMGKYVITPAEFEKDLIYLKEHSYTAITMTDLINYVYNNTELPPKPVIITFDDGNLNNYLYGKPILEKYEMKAVMSVVGKYSELFSTSPSPTNDPNYAHVSWNQVKEMSDSGYFEIQNHTFNLHSITKKRYGAKRNKGESLESYKNTLTSDIGKLQNKLYEVTGIMPNTFTYPYGGISKDSVSIIRELGFKATLSCVEGVNIIDRSKEDVLFGLKRKNRPHGISSQSFFKNFCP